MWTRGRSTQNTPGMDDESLVEPSIITLNQVRPAHLLFSPHGNKRKKDTLTDSKVGIAIILVPRDASVYTSIKRLHSEPLGTIPHALGTKAVLDDRIVIICGPPWTVAMRVAGLIFGSQQHIV
jgi:hypothetical protein